ncbi:uncharacterized protein LOC144762242 [Lissotriton helveticus]
MQGPSRRVNNHGHRAPLLRILLLSPVQNPYHPPVPTGTAAQLQRSRRGQEDQRHLHLHQQQWGGEPTAAGDVTPSKKPTRKELAVRARQRKLQAIVEAYRRLVDQAEEEEEEAAAAAAASSNAPAPKPAGLHRRGQAATRRRVVTSSAAPPQQHACKCRCREFPKKILCRVATKFEEERKKLEDGIEERVKIMVDKHLKARRL